MKHRSLSSEFQQFIHLSKYARWDYEKKRRETWGETVERYVQFFREHIKERCGYVLTQDEVDNIRDRIFYLEVMPSMRCLMTAGPALRRDEVSGYNCSFLLINRVRAFDELLFMLMCGTGVGFSVERQYIQHLPVIEETMEKTDTTIVVADSKLGWSKALRELLNLLYAGQIPKWDMTRIRPPGSPLKTFGGRSSGSKGLEEMFAFAVNMFKEAAGRKLTSIECHDLCCKISGVVTVGGIRRAATISLSNLSDDRMRNAKSGQWWEVYPHRALANNSIAFTEKPEIGTFIKEWLSLYESKSGERGIFNRQGTKKQMDIAGKRDSGHDFGINPCVTGDTTVQTPNGKVSILQIVEDMKEGKSFKCLSYNETRKRAEYKRIISAKLTKYDAKIVCVRSMSGDPLYLTPDHLVFTKNRGYVEAKDIVVNDSILSLKKNEDMFTHAMNTIVCGYTRDVYDLEVEDNHNFFANNILVHNCGEIVLRDRQLCNLTEVVARPDDTEETLMKKVEWATILGTLQSTLTKFRYVSSEWAKNCEEERLLGVSITGITDNRLLNGKEDRSGLPALLDRLKRHAVSVNADWAKRLGISAAKAITCCKPSGTVGALVNASNGIHSRWSRFYIRSVRISREESISKFMLGLNFPHEPDVMNPETTTVFYFPIKFDGNDEDAIFRGDMNAIEQLEFWKIYKDHWTDHNPSVTIYIKEHEWIRVAAWVYDKFDSICGVSFLPHAEHIYQQAPFQECTEEEYESLLDKMPKNVNWLDLSKFEEEDLTVSSQELACTGSSCEIADLQK